MDSSTPLCNRIIFGILSTRYHLMENVTDSLVWIDDSHLCGLDPSFMHYIRIMVEKWRHIISPSSISHLAYSGFLFHLHLGTRVVVSLSHWMGYLVCFCWINFYHYY